MRTDKTNPIEIFGDSLYYVLRDLILSAEAINKELSGKIGKTRERARELGLGEYHADYLLQKELYEKHWNDKALKNASKWYRKHEMQKEDIWEQKIENARQIAITELTADLFPNGNFKRQCKCPFHPDKSPSFSVSVDKNLFHCFGCGAGGDVIEFTKLRHNLSFKDAVEYLNN